jgi:hypothetical protein
MSNSERVALRFVSSFYDGETKKTKCIDEGSLPKHTLFNCTYEITRKLKSTKIPELLIDDIWNDIIRNKLNEQPLAKYVKLSYRYKDFKGDSYDYHANYDYEVAIIFGCVYVILSLDRPNEQACLQRIKEKAGCNAQIRQYFSIIERKFIEMQKQSEANRKNREQTQKEQTQKEQKITASISVIDMLDVLDRNYCSNRKKAELLEWIAYVLYSKQYPDDICGMLDKRIGLLRQAEQETSASSGSSIYLSAKKGIKIFFIRVINILCELFFFTDKNGGRATKKEVFRVFGNALNIDLSTFHNDLSVSKSAANNDMNNTTDYLDVMRAKQIEINQK